MVIDDPIAFTTGGGIGQIYRFKFSFQNFTPRPRLEASQVGDGTHRQDDPQAQNQWRLARRSETMERRTSLYLQCGLRLDRPQVLGVDVEAVPARPLPCLCTRRPTGVRSEFVDFTPNRIKMSDLRYPHPS